MLQESVYILDVEGKDVISPLTVSKNKKYLTSFDYSLETDKLIDVCKKNLTCYNKDFFYELDGKKRSDVLINVSFSYSAKLYEKSFLKVDGVNKHVYIINKFVQTLSEDVEFVNGVCEKNGAIVAILPDVEIKEANVKLPRGFKYKKIEDDKIIISSSPSKIEKILGCGEIRDLLYENGFIVNGRKYVRFKRTSGSARIGKCMFILEELYEDMFKWSCMGIDVKEGDKVDLASFEAYISLTTSSIIDKIEIQPHEILMIDDFKKNVFKDDVICTRNINENSSPYDRLETKQETIEFSNSIWDGQSLLDSSLFCEKYENRGFLLLRNRFFKSACFNTNIQLFFKENNITEISQLNGKTMATKISDIKLITTPSSIKYIKFGKFEKYISELESTFGVVKYDKPTHFFKGEMVSTHYQLINTIEFTKKEMSKFLSNSVNYINLLKTDIDVFKHYLGIKYKEDFDIGVSNTSTEFVYKMLQLNDDFQYTAIFKKFRKDIIASYVDNIKMGHVLVKGNYSVLFGNGIEMLKSSANLWDFKSSTLPKGEIISKNFNMGEELLGTRSPHVTISNILLTKNCDRKDVIDEVYKFFNMSKQIVYINSFDDNILERLSSADFDSDQMALTNDKVLVSQAKKNYDKFLVPTSLVSASPTERFNTWKDKSSLDKKTSVNLIGEIVNASQVLNSLLWDYKYNNNDSINLEELFWDICQLDIMSCIEIDSAKKEFDLDIANELTLIKNKWYEKTEDGKNIRPLFFKFITSKNQFVAKCDYRKMQTGMDILHEVLDEDLKKLRNKNSKTIPFRDVIINRTKSMRIDSRRIKNILDVMTEYKSNINSLWVDESIDSKNRFSMSNDIRTNVINELKNMDLKYDEVRHVYLQVANAEDDRGVKKEEYKGLSRTITNLLYHSYPDYVNCILIDTSNDKKTILTTTKTKGKCVLLYEIPYYSMEKTVRNKIMNSLQH